MKRVIDIIFSILAILILFPVLFLVMLILRLTGEGEIFFYQERVGKNYKMFKLLKFATMLKNSENMGSGTITLKDDFRILPFGKFLRKTKINELPQIFNVLLGDISLIGPRPQTKRCFNAFPKKSQNKIASVRPGLSGIGSIIFRDEEKMMENSGNHDHFYDNVIMPYKGLLEEWYVENNNIFNYISLIILTIWVVLSSNTKILFKIYDLPKPPDELRKFLI